MIAYISTRGKAPPVGFDQAVLQGFASDMGLFVPDTMPRFSGKTLYKLSGLTYPQLAFEILSRFIDPAVIPHNDLKALIDRSFTSFTHPDVLGLYPMEQIPGTWILELFHGPSLSFKDIAMGFLIRVMDYLLVKKGKHLNIILATTGDTGPAAAHASAGRKAIDCWPLYPGGMITREQEGQMICLDASNIHPVRVRHCPDGGDDLDRIVAELFADQNLVQKLSLSSVNSINWCRVLCQTVHYFYSYFRVCRSVGDSVVFSVPTGAFGNLFAGYMARAMGLPVHQFICSVNANQTLTTVFNTGLFKQWKLRQTFSSAMDIVVPYNFWRFLYFATGRDPDRIRNWMDQFQAMGQVQLPHDALSAITHGFRAVSVSDSDTLETIARIHQTENRYLLDPHGAVALAGALKLRAETSSDMPVICMATAHPAKFPHIIEKALGTPLPDSAFHPGLISSTRELPQAQECDLSELKTFLIHAIEQRRCHG